MAMQILVTGGAGYIGSHAVLALLEAGYEVCVFDNLTNSSFESLRRVGKIAGRAPEFIEGDIRNTSSLEELFSSRQFEAVLHFAGLKAVGESMKNPLSYYENNVAGTIKLCRAMENAGVYKLVFSSSAVVYGNSAAMPVSEKSLTERPPSPYGNTKLMIEQLLEELVRADKRWRIAVLRYFNPVGAHSSGLIGEDPCGIPSNLIPYVSQVAVGKLDAVKVFGNDYSTPDGTGIRDYIHVLDLAEGHLCALDALAGRVGLSTWNLGTGRGYSVLEVIRAFEQASGRKIPFNISPRRDGDIMQSWADVKKAAEELGWKAKRGLAEMMADAWRWQSENPNGYQQ